jgi:L-asparaginase/beta-aspartyl-peptidase (threonine type)
MTPNPTSRPAAIVTHGGAGGPLSHRDGCEAAAGAGLGALREGAGPLEAVIRATEVLEDDPRMNAGTGSNFRLDGKTIEMDAAVMNHDLKFGAVAALRRVRHPVRVAEKVLLTPHLFLAGEGANLFARNLGFEDYDPSTEKAHRRYEEVLEFLAGQGDGKEMSRWHGIDPTPLWNYPEPLMRKLKKVTGPSDTVGAVARDEAGRCAAALSTGGTAIMLFGRVGDSPIIGGGLYAGPHGAVACTGEGEEIMRVVLAKQVYDWMGQGATAQQAAEKGVALIPQEYTVGIICICPATEGAADNRTMPTARGFVE